MTFWTIREGQKTGPFEDYEFREMIRSGEVEADHKVWHQGAEGWIRADEVAVLEGEFQEEKVEEEKPVVLKREPFRPWRRFGARFFDSSLYTLILAGVARMAGENLLPTGGEVPSVWLIIGTVLPAILIETALVNSMGYTPGKWLLAMRVETLEGRRLTMGEAFIRSMRVWILGMGMRQPILAALGHVLSLWFGLKKGALLWDLQSGFDVRSGKLESRRIAYYWVALLAIFVVNSWLVWPELQPMMEEIQRQAK